MYLGSYKGFMIIFFFEKKVHTQTHRKVGVTIFFLFSEKSLKITIKPLYFNLYTASML